MLAEFSIKLAMIKIQSENMKMTWNINLFVFYMIYNFSKYDGFEICK